MCLFANVFGIDIDEVINHSIKEVSMQERRYGIQATRRDAEAAERARLHSGSMRNHIPGTSHRHSDGVVYAVQTSGAWRRTTPKSCVLRRRSF
jgi:hypothetical protein